MYNSLQNGGKNLVENWLYDQNQKKTTTKIMSIKDFTGRLVLEERKNSVQKKLITKATTDFNMKDFKPILVVGVW